MHDTVSIERFILYLSCNLHTFKSFVIAVGPARARHGGQKARSQLLTYNKLQATIARPFFPYLYHNLPHIHQPISNEHLELVTYTSPPFPPTSAASSSPAPPAPPACRPQRQRPRASSTTTPWPSSARATAPTARPLSRCSATSAQNTTPLSSTKSVCSVLLCFPCADAAPHEPMLMY